MTTTGTRERKYCNGKIYKIEPICDHEDGEFYIGSTTKQYLSQRFAAHKGDYNKWLRGTSGRTRSFILFDKYGFENCKIILLELVNATSKDQLLSREAHFIKTFQCVNKIIPLQTSSEHYEANKVAIIAWQKQHYEDNKVEILARHKQYNKANKVAISERLKQRRLQKKSQQVTNY